MLSAARVAVSVQFPVASVTVIVVPFVPVAVHPVDAPALNTYAPVLSPPDAVAVPGVPYVTEPGAVTTTGVV